MRAGATNRNGDGWLLLGQYVLIRVLVGDQPDTLMVPQAALGSRQLGKFVCVDGDALASDVLVITSCRD